MEPTLVSNNILVTERISPRINGIIRGDIIIAKNPTNPAQHICKRVIGLPGDRIVMQQQSPFNLNPFSNVTKENSTVEKAKPLGNVNDAIDENETSSLTPNIFQNKVVIVPRGHVWIEGDNVENSSDSRHYGPIPQGLIKSRAVGRLWPPKDMKLF